MALNRDGLDPSKPVDFVTHQRILREQREGKKDAAKVAPKTGRRGKSKTVGNQDDSQSTQEADATE